MYIYDGTTFTLIADKTCYKTDSYNGAEVLFEGLSVSTEYVVYFYGDETSNSDLLEVALKKSLGAVDPVFSLTESTIGLDETSQIQVGSKGNLDGITLVNLASSDNTVATVDATGLITPLKAGTTNITFTSEAQVDDENTQSNEEALSRKSNGYSLWDDDSEE